MVICNFSYPLNDYVAWRAFQWEGKVKTGQDCTWEREMKHSLLRVSEGTHLGLRRWQPSCPMGLPWRWPGDRGMDELVLGNLEVLCPCEHWLFLKGRAEVPGFAEWQPARLRASPALLHQRSRLLLHNNCDPLLSCLSGIRFISVLFVLNHGFTI